MNNGLEEKLKEYFTAREEVSMAFLFGSVATGRQMAESDVDVAVWFNHDWTIEDANKMEGALMDMAKRDVDLIVLNKCRPTIAWAAMRGKKLLIRDYKLFLNKLLAVSAEAEDFQGFILDLWTLKRKYGGAFA